MNITLCQHIVSSDIQANFAHIEAQIKQAKPSEWIVFPEGMLSGYEPDNRDYLKDIVFQVILAATKNIQTLCNEHNCHCIFGTVYPSTDGKIWYNTTIICLSGQDKAQLYYKNNLAYLDRDHFAHGNDLPVYDYGDIRIGIQMCREILFPEQWRALKQQGAKVIFHISNAIKPQDDIWRHLLITRALENQIYVVSVNNAAEPQTLPSCVISPKGEILSELPTQQNHTTSTTLDLSQVTDYYISQNRNDLARVSTETIVGELPINGMTWLEQEFYRSWVDMQLHFSQSLITSEPRSYLRPICRLLLYLRHGWNSKYSRQLRAGLQLDMLVLSRSLKYGLRQDQHFVRTSTASNEGDIYKIEYSKGDYDSRDEIVVMESELVKAIIPFLDRLLEQPID